MNKIAMKSHHAYDHVLNTIHFESSQQAPIFLQKNAGVNSSEKNSHNLTILSNPFPGTSGVEPSDQLQGGHISLFFHYSIFRRQAVLVIGF